MRTSNILLSKRTVARLAPLLQDLLDLGATQYSERGGYASLQQEFNGWLNVQMLNAGLTSLWAGPVDVDRPYGKNEVTFTTVFTYARDDGRQMGLLIDVTYRTPMTAETVTEGTA